MLLNVHFSFIIHAQLIDMIGSLLDRSVIHKNFQHKYPILVNMCNNELNSVKKLFDQQLALSKTASGPVINKNMPRVAGVLRWSQELKERIQLPMEKLKTIEHGFVIHAHYACTYTCACTCTCTLCMYIGVSTYMYMYLYTCA